MLAPAPLPGTRFRKAPPNDLTLDGLEALFAQVQRFREDVSPELDAREAGPLTHEWLDAVLAILYRLIVDRARLGAHL